MIASFKKKKIAKKMIVKKKKNNSWLQDSPGEQNVLSSLESIQQGHLSLYFERSFQSDANNARVLYEFVEVTTHQHIRLRWKSNKHKNKKNIWLRWKSNKHKNKKNKNNNNKK